MERMLKGKLTIFVIFAIAQSLLFTGCFERNKLFNSEDLINKDLYTVEIVPANTAIPAGIDYSLKAIARYVDGTTKDVTAEALWESGDPLVAMVTSSGTVTGIQPGFVFITALYEGLTGTASIEIHNADLLSIDVTPVNSSIPAGLTCQFTATGHFSDATAMDLTDQVTWTSSSPSIASVSNTDGTRGFATALGTGTTVISAELNGIGNATDLTVTPAEIVSVELEPANPEIQKTKTLQIKAYGHYTNGEKHDVTSDAVWTSSDMSVLTVSDTPGSKGVITGIDTGQSTVMASYGALQGTTLVTVTELMLAKWVNNGIDEPRVITSTDTKFTLAWPALQNAVKYEIYYVTKGDPLEETKFMETTGTQIDVTENTNYNLRIKAVDAIDTILDKWVIRGSVGMNKSGAYPAILPVNFVSGNFSYNFEEPAIPAFFTMYNAEQITQAGGYIQMNQNKTDDGPDLGIGYDTGGNRYVHLRFKQFQHRNGTHYGSYYVYLIRILSFTNSNAFFGIGNFHEEYAGLPGAPLYGTNYWYREYDSNDYNPYSDIRQQIDGTEFFDCWITWDFKIDLALGAFTIELFDETMTSVFVTTIDTARHYGDKFFLFFNPYGWFTGHYMRIDDLLIESSDTPY